MNLDTKDLGNVRVVTPQSEHLDFENVGDFRRQMDEIVAEVNRVVLDMGNLEFVDSSGLGAILSLLRRLSAEGGDLRIAGVSPTVAALLQLVRLDQIIEVYETSQEAAQSFP
jgi:anti-sigma B factor antagonist